MIQAIIQAIRSFGTRAAAFDRAATGFAKKAVTPSKAALRRQAQHPNDPRHVARSPLGMATHRMSEVGQASWGIDSITSRFNSSAPTFVETLTVKVYGQRWAQVKDLYVLAMTIVVARVDGSLWLGGQAVRCTIDVTGKYVEVEFQQTARGIAERSFANLFGNGSPFVMFHNPDWLTNDVLIKGRKQAIETIPDVLAPGGSADDTTVLGARLSEGWAERNVDQENIFRPGYAWFTGNAVVNQGPDGQPWGLKLLSHDKDTNPAPLSDGASRGTDLCALVAAALHPAGENPDVPPTDRLYDPKVGPEPGGCLPSSHRPANGLAGWFERFANASRRWIKGWQPTEVGDPKGPRPYDTPGC